MSKILNLKNTKYTIFNSACDEKRVKIIKKVLLIIAETFSIFSIRKIKNQL